MAISMYLIHYDKLITVEICYEIQKISLETFPELHEIQQQKNCIIMSYINKREQIDTFFIFNTKK